MNASLLLGRNDVIWLARLGSPGYTGQNLAEQWKINIFTTEAFADKSIYRYLTRMSEVDEIVNANTSKVPGKAKY